MRQDRKPIYIYHNREFVGKAKSQTEAAEKTNVTYTTVFQIANKQRGTTRHGYYYSFTKLTEEELNELPIKESNTNYANVNGKGCTKNIDKQNYEVNCTDRKVTYQSPSKIIRIEELKSFIYARLQERWRKIPQNVATLERTYIKETLNSLM